MAFRDFDDGRKVLYNERPFAISTIEEFFRKQRVVHVHKFGLEVLNEQYKGEKSMFLYFAKDKDKTNDEDPAKGDFINELIEISKTNLNSFLFAKCEETNPFCSDL